MKKIGFLSPRFRNFELDWYGELNHVTKKRGSYPIGRFEEIPESYFSDFLEKCENNEPFDRDIIRTSIFSPDKFVVVTTLL
jgi:hypothetical protein